MLVADGYAGNVALKVMEGTSDVLLRSVREAAMSSTRSKLGGLLLRPALRGLRDQIDPEAHGGAVLLGLRHLGVVPHGNFGARGFASAIEVAARGVRDDVLGRTHERLAERRRAAQGAYDDRCHDSAPRMTAPGGGAARHRPPRHGPRGIDHLPSAAAATLPDQP